MNKKLVLETTAPFQGLAELVAYDEGLFAKEGITIEWIDREKGVDKSPQMHITSHKDAPRFAIGLAPVGEEHHAELAHDRVEAAVREGQFRRIGRLEIDLLPGSKLCARDFEHCRIEIRRRQANAGRQDIAQPASDDPGACRRLQNPRWIASGDTMRDVRGIIGEDQRPQTSIIVLRYAANVSCRIAIH